MKSAKPRINSRSKGKRGELELAAWLSERGWPARRGQQFKGGADSPDVACERLARLGVQVECKRTEALNLYSALEQAQEDAGEHAQGVVLHRRNQRRWVAIMDAEFLLKILENMEEF